MAAANTDKLRKGARKWVGQIGAGGVSDASVTTIPLSSATGLPTDTAIDIVIDRVSSDGTLTPSLEETITGVVSGDNIVNAVRGEEGTAQAHSAGAVVEVLLTNNMWGDMVDAFLVEHGQDGTHTVSGADGTFITGTAGTSGYLAKWNADGDLVDGFEMLDEDNMATDSATKLASQQSIKAYVDNTVKIISIQVFASGTSTATGDGAAFFRVPSDLNGYNIIGVAAAVYTAGTTGTLDIQLRNKTQTADILSTKMTIDSGETDTSTAATAAVINTAEDDLTTGDVIAVDIDAVHTTPAAGLTVEIRVQKA